MKAQFAFNRIYLTTTSKAPAAQMKYWDEI